MERNKISDLIITDEMFYIEIDSQYKAFITYTYSNEKYTLKHCEVPEELRGRGIGQELIKRVFHHLKIDSKETIILCSYIKAVTQKLSL